jgi:hypothetical protein
LKIASNVLNPEGLWQLKNNSSQPRQGFSFFSNMNKPDKFGIKFWLAACVTSMYLLKAFPYMGKEEHRPADKLQG